MTDFAEMRTIDYLYVGAHIGNTDNDYLFKTDISNNNIVLIEPVPYLFDKLKENYKEKQKTNNISFLNIAVSNKDDFIKLYIPSEKNDFSNCPDFSSQLASVNSAHISSHIPWLLVDEIKVPCFTLNTILKNMKTIEINNLITDTEGHDYDILMDLDLSIIKPKTILFEHIHMDGINSSGNAINHKGEKYERLLYHFKEHGYTVTKKDRMDTLISLSKDSSATE